MASRSVSTNPSVMESRVLTSSWYDLERVFADCAGCVTVLGIITSAQILQKVYPQKTQVTQAEPCSIGPPHSGHNSASEGTGFDIPGFRTCSLFEPSRNTVMPLQ